MSNLIDQKKLKPTKLLIKCHKCMNSPISVKELCSTCEGTGYLPVFEIKEKPGRKAKNTPKKGTKK